MCYNCGCGMSNDDMGMGHALVDDDGKSITDKTFSKLAERWGIDDHHAKELAYGMLAGEKSDSVKETEMESLYQEASKSQGMSVENSKEETKSLLKEVLKNKN